MERSKKTKMIQINPTIPVITPKGHALAHFLIDYGIEHNLFWVCFQDNTGECWIWSNKDIRAQKNITHGREHISPFYNPQHVAFPHKHKKNGNKFAFLPFKKK